MAVTTIILAISLIIIMFGMGLSLTVEDFKRVFIEPKAMLIGLVNQLVLLPMVGFILISIFELKPEIAIGVIILVACPGGPTSNLISHLAKGDTALSISLTAISSFVTILTIPFVINLGLNMVYGSNADIQLDVPGTMLQVFIVVIIPVSLGMLIKAKKEVFALRMENPVRKASGIIFALVLAGVIFKEKDNIGSYFAQAGIVTLTLNVVTMALGFFGSSFLKLSRKQTISISIESGIQNGTLAIAIATGVMLNSEYAIAPAIYGLLMFITSALVIYWGINKAKTETA